MSSMFRSSRTGSGFVILDPKSKMTTHVFTGKDLADVEPICSVSAPTRLPGMELVFRRRLRTTAGGGGGGQAIGKTPDALMSWMD